MGRTNIVLDDRLVREGLAAVQVSLEAGAGPPGADRVAEECDVDETSWTLRGQVKWEGDLAELRTPSALIVVDTTVWIRLPRGQGYGVRPAPYGARGRTTPRIALVDIVYCEVLQGIRDEDTYQPDARQLTGSSDLASAWPRDVRERRQPVSKGAPPGAHHPAKRRLPDRRDLPGGRCRDLSQRPRLRCHRQGVGPDDPPPRVNELPPFRTRHRSGPIRNRRPSTPSSVGSFRLSRTRTTRCTSRRRRRASRRPPSISAACSPRSNERLVGGRARRLTPAARAHESFRLDHARLRPGQRCRGAPSSGQRAPFGNPDRARHQGRSRLSCGASRSSRPLTSVPDPFTRRPISRCSARSATRRPNRAGLRPHAPRRAPASRSSARARRPARWGRSTTCSWSTTRRGREPCASSSGKGTVSLRRRSGDDTAADRTAAAALRRRSCGGRVRQRGGSPALVGARLLPRRRSWPKASCPRPRRLSGSRQVSAQGR